MICILDHQDSFTYNIYAAFKSLGESAEVFSTASTSICELESRSAEIESFVLSPGPGHPDEALLFHEVLKKFSNQKPILGVCLGHQVIVQFFGGKIVKSPHIMHGKTVSLEHSNSGLYRNIPSPFQAMRYNSLEASYHFPEELELSSWSRKGDRTTVMGVKHKRHLIYGVQFHPESIGTPEGHFIFKNFLNEIRK